MAVNGVTVIALEWGIFVPLATVFVLVRYITRHLYSSKFTVASNWLVGVSFVLFLLAPSLDTVAWRAGFYSDQAALETPVSDDTAVYGLIVAYFNWVMFYVTLWVIKGAILSVYYQLIPKSSRVHWISLHALGAVTGMAFLTTLLFNLLWCRPIRLNWSLDTKESCFAPFDTTVIVITGAMQVAVDVAIVILPFPILFAVNASTSEKASIAAVFAMGVLSIVATVSRLILIFATESLELYTLLARTELTVGMIVACSPALRVLATQSSATAAAAQSGIFASGALGGGEPVSRFSRPTSSGTHGTAGTMTLPPLHQQRRRPHTDGRRTHQTIFLPPLNFSKTALHHHHRSSASLGNTSTATQHLLSQRSSLTGLRSPSPTHPGRPSNASLARPSADRRPSTDLLFAFPRSPPLPPIAPPPHSGRTTATTGTATPVPNPPSPAAFLPPPNHLLHAYPHPSCRLDPRPRPPPPRVPSYATGSSAPGSPVGPPALRWQGQGHAQQPKLSSDSAATGERSIEDMYFGLGESARLAEAEAMEGFYRMEVVEPEGGVGVAVTTDEEMEMRAIGVGGREGEGEGDGGEEVGVRGGVGGAGQEGARRWRRTYGADVARGPRGWVGGRWMGKGGVGDDSMWV
ncbi:hypothetical protein GTA08_BOTSDO04009 [Neofusicoccum parvum]|nr:hypothetical protein GTA08_BOTSDO04009 [Neofusicoccum parvum]